MHLLLVKRLGLFSARRIPMPPRMCRLPARGYLRPRGFGRGGSAVGGPVGGLRLFPAPAWRGVRGKTGAGLLLRALVPASSRIGFRTGRRRLHPGVGARHLVRFSVSPPGLAYCFVQCAVGWSIPPWGGPCPGLLALWGAVVAADGSRGTRPIALPFGMEPPICSGAAWRGTPRASWCLPGSVRGGSPRRGCRRGCRASTCP